MEEQKEQNYLDQYYGTKPQAEESSFDNPIKTKHWMLVYLVQMIPIANIIFLIMWAMGKGNTSETKKGYARAQLIWTAISIVIFVVVYGAMLALILASVETY